MRPLPLLLLLLIFVSAANLVAQTTDLSCAQKLRSARSVYDQGRLQELPGLLYACLKDGFSPSEQVEAYKLLILTYIYLQEPEKADQAMQHLLETDHFYKLDPAVDPIEFRNLHDKFRYKPLFSVGAKFGANTNHVNVLKNYFIWGPSQGKGEYQANVGIQIGGIFEKVMSKNEKWVANPEIFYSSYSIVALNGSLSSQDENEPAPTDNSEFTIEQTRLNLNLLMQYKFSKGDMYEKFTPYASFGPTVYYLLGSSFGGDVTVTSQRTIPAFTTKENYRAIGIGFTASAGIKYKIGSIFLTADVRYVHGLHNIVNADKRFEQTETNLQLQDAGYIDNDFSVSHSMINIGLIVPYFNPKKLIR